MHCFSCTASVFNPSVGGGELFDRIIDENYKLMELDAVMFIRQICEGLQHMHKMYILHLDLKVGCDSNLPLFKVGPMKITESLLFLFFAHPARKYSLREQSHK